MRAVVACVCAIVLLAALPANAQDPDKLVTFHFGSGPTMTTGETNNHFGSGYNINFGVTFNIRPSIGIMAEYSYNGLGQKQVNLPVSAQPVGSGADTPFYGDMNMQYGNFDVVFKPQVQGKVAPFVLAGAGVYYRPINVTTPGAGYVPGYCDPFWYYCAPGGWVPVDYIVGSRSSTDFGMTFGGGVAFRVAESASVFVEARFHYIWGPKFTVSGTTYDSNSSYFPITFGIRF